MRSRSKNYLRIAIFFLKKVAKREDLLKVKITAIVYKLEDIKNEKSPIIGKL